MFRGKVDAKIRGAIYSYARKRLDEDTACIYIEDSSPRILECLLLCFFCSPSAFLLPFSRYLSAAAATMLYSGAVETALHDPMGETAAYIRPGLSLRKGLI